MKKQDTSLSLVKKFLFNIIHDEFSYGYVPQYHQDIQHMESYYIKP
ncbi:MAG: hypothetical protein ACLPHE_00850 [Methanobacterium sp.]